MPDAITARKQELRAEMRRRRLAVDRREERTVSLWEHVCEVPAVQAARVVMAFAAVGGEPDTARFVAWCESDGKAVVVPAYDPAAPPPVEPSVPDVVIVPGLAFTSSGARLGQGVGWYDRFLASVRSDCTTIGVGFMAQLVDQLPEEPHDVRLDLVITDEGPAV